MRVRLIGANPFITLYAADQAVAYASVWRVDWSERGSGHALVFGDSTGTRVIGPDPALGEWLAESFNQYFKDVVAGLPWTPPEVTIAPVTFDLDLARGFRSAAADVVVELGEPMDRQLGRNDAYDLGGTPNVLSTVWMPCKTGSISVDGAAVDGALRITADPLYSSAAIADAEVWCHPE